jgi:excisionase family DNA binding protein
MRWRTSPLDYGNHRLEDQRGDGWCKGRRAGAWRNQHAHSAEGWVGKKAAAEHFNVSQRTFYSWMKKGVIPYVRLGRSVRFQLSAVDEAINRRVGSAGRY